MKFTKRESEIVDIVKSGTFLNKDIAHLLDIKDETVREHFRNIYIKAEVNNKVEFIYKLTNDLLSQGLSFENSLVAIFEEDFSNVKKHIDSLKEKGIKDFYSYFKQNSDSLKICADLIKVKNVNNKTTSILNLEDKILEKSLWNFFDENAKEVFARELDCFAQGNLKFFSQTTHLDNSGQSFFGEIEASIDPNYKDTWGKVFVGLVKYKNDD